MKLAWIFCHHLKLERKTFFLFTLIKTAAEKGRKVEKESEKQETLSDGFSLSVVLCLLLRSRFFIRKNGNKSRRQWKKAGCARKGRVRKKYVYGIFMPRSVFSPLREEEKERTKKGNIFKDKRLLNMKNTSKFHSLLIWVFFSSSFRLSTFASSVIRREKGGKRRVKNPERFFPSERKINVHRGRSEKSLVLTPRRLVNLWSHAEIFMEKVFLVFFGAWKNNHARLMR